MSAYQEVIKTSLFIPNSNFSFECISFCHSQRSSCSFGFNVKHKIKWYFENDSFSTLPSRSQLVPWFIALILHTDSPEMFSRNSVVLMHRHRHSIDLALSDSPPSFSILGRNLLPHKQGCQGNSLRLKWLQNSCLISLVWSHLRGTCVSKCALVFSIVSVYAWVCLQDCLCDSIYIQSLRTYA